MKILIVGSGGREHALAWKVAQSSEVTQVLVAPGNAGTAREHKVRNVAIQGKDIEALREFALIEKVDLTIVGPEAPLEAGIVDMFTQAGLLCFGPTKAAARLESSKKFAKDFLYRYQIPTAAYAAFTDMAAAHEYLKKQKFPLVIKADGLAAGKGVIIVQNLEEALTTVDDMLNQQRFGEASQQIVIEAFLEGEEVSFIVMADGKHVLPLATSQDHKRRDNQDEGPNTGGMGAYSPAPIVSDALFETIMEQVIYPTIRGMEAEGTPYTGFLYAGLMISSEGVPNVLEFNCRLGDPETQPLLFRLESDLVQLCLAALHGKLDTVTAKWDHSPALGVVMAAGGYPDSYTAGDVINGLEIEDTDDCKVFHAGTQLMNDQVLTHGGRVLCVTAKGKTLQEAQDRAYERVRLIDWPNVYYRTDIGYRAL